MEQPIPQARPQWQEIITEMQLQLRAEIINNLDRFIYWYDEAAGFEVHKWFTCSYQPQLVQRLLEMAKISPTNEQTLRLFLHRQISLILDEVLAEVGITSAIEPVRVLERTDMQSWRYD